MDGTIHDVGRSSRLASFAIPCVMTTMACSCSLVVDTSDLDTGARDGATSDVSARTDAGASSGDAGSDAGAPTDAATDTGPGIHPYVKAVLEDGPALYYRFEEPSGATTAKDETTMHDGTYVPGGTLGVEGVVGKGILLSGTQGGGVDVGLVFSFPGTQPFTTEAWLRPESYDDEYRFLFHVNDYQMNLRQSYGTYVHVTGGLTFERYVSDDGYAASLKPPPPVQQWHHVVSVYNGVRLAIFVDGAKQDDSSDPRSAVEKTTDFYVGTDSGGRSPKGVLDEAAVYDKALSDDRILVHYKLGSSK